MWLLEIIIVLFLLYECVELGDKLARKGIVIDYENDDETKVLYLQNKIRKRSNIISISLMSIVVLGAVLLIEPLRLFVAGLLIAFAALLYNDIVGWIVLGIPIGFIVLIVWLIGRRKGKKSEI